MGLANMCTAIYTPWIYMCVLVYVQKYIYWDYKKYNCIWCAIKCIYFFSRHICA